MKPVICEKRTYSVQEIMKILNIGKNSAYKLVASNAFKTIRIGKTIRVSKVSFDNWLNSQI
ncbi:MAG: helix-turn-helix domain-containing protein [Erysipelotrichaceae bacterium]|nr:helix-turn-helix domain-containing protein [Erysipelotrichaceae bacterium]